jgi:hypothetical protein
LKQEEVMAEQEKPTGNETAKANKLELAEKPPSGQVNGAKTESKTESKGEPAGLALRTQQQSVPGSIELAGTRPISASHLEVYATYLNNRPIEANHMQIMEYIDNRPVFASDIVVQEVFSGRPVVASDPRLMEASGLPGGRPIASNEIGEPEGLMGYID